MEEINLKDLFSFFIQKIWIILLVTILVVTLGMSYTIFLKTPLYRGNTTMILVKNGGESGNSSYTSTDIAVNQQLVSTYSEIVKSRSVLNRVIEEINLNDTVKSLSSRVNVTGVSNTEIIKVTVSDENPNTAVRIADTIADVFKEEVMEIYKLQNVTIIDKAEEESTPYNIQVVRDGVIYLAVGVVLSMAGLFIAYYFDTSIKSSEEIESRLGVPVIGNIPKN